jgi:PAS domain S-box-containing protein
MEYDLEYVLDCALDGIFIVRNNGELVLFNRACEELYGVSPDDLVNKACLRLTDFENTWKALLNGKGELSYGELASKKERVTLYHKNGKQVWVETVYTPVFDREKKEIAYVMGVIKDITELKDMEEEKENLLAERDHMRDQLESKYDFSAIMGKSPQILSALKLVAQVAKENTSVILVGESGTGKELFAKAIHYNSPRADRPFVALNCAAFPDTLIESELFGYEKGAFTGAEKYKPGKIEMASGGTLFLDEVTEMSFSAQAKMLRVIQEREFEMLGGNKTMRADIRIIASTNRQLEKMVAEGKFREDLYYRLYVYPIIIPPLRGRQEDVPLLIDHFLLKLNREMGKKITGISPQAREILVNYSWPGNVRELQNVVERMLILCKGNRIEMGDLPRYLMGKSTKLLSPGLVDDIKGSLENHLQQVESDALLKSLKKCGYNKTKAADLLGLARSTFRYKLSKIPKTLWQSA